MKERVQVRDLDAPERIQPAPVQSDTYARPVAPPINNDLERLSGALSQFGNTMSALGAKQKAEDEKRLKDAQLAEYERWKAATSSDDQLIALRAGKVPISGDPIIHEVFRKDHAILEAQRLTSEIDNDFRSMNLASQDFDVDKYVREKAAPYAARMAGDDRRMIYFGDALDKVRAHATRERDRVRGIVQTHAIEQKGADVIRGVIVKGIEDGASAQQIMDAVRGDVYKEIGPRMQKGSLDLSYGRMDELKLDVLEELAANPKYAQKAVAMLRAGRRGLDPSSPDIKSLAENVRFSPKVERIEKIASRTLGDAKDAEVRDILVAGALKAFGRGDGDFGKIVDFDRENPEDGSRRIKMSASEIRDAAVKAYLGEVRRATGGKEDFDAEFGRLMANNVIHPEYKQAFEDVFRGVGNLNLKEDGISADQIGTVIQWAQKYSDIADSNLAYADKMVTGDAARFFKLYRTLTRYAGYEPDKAASAAVRAFATDPNTGDGKLLAGKLEDARQTVRNMDFARWNPFAGAVVNRDEVMRHLLPLAEGLARVEGVDGDEALKRAAEHITNRAAYINGRVVFHPGISQGDEEHVQPIFDHLFSRHSAYLKSIGVKDATHLSLAPAAGGGKFVVVKWDGAEVVLPTGEGTSGEPANYRPRTISEADIQKLLKTGKDRKAAEARERMRKALQATEEGTSAGLPGRDVPMDVWNPRY